MTGKGALSEIRYQARQAFYRRQALGLPALVTKMRVERCDALLMKQEAVRDERMAREEWARYHQANADRMNGLLNDPVEEVYNDGALRIALINDPIEALR